MPHRLPQWFEPDAEYAGALDPIGPTTGMRGWVLGKTEPKRHFSVTVVANDRVVARGFTDTYRADISEKIGDEVSCGFVIPWTQFDVAAISEIIALAYNATLTVVVPEIDHYLSGALDGANSAPILLSDCLTFIDQDGAASVVDTKNDNIAVVKPFVRNYISRWLDHDSKIAGAVDAIEPTAGLRGWILSSTEPSRRFSVAVVVNTRVIARGSTGTYRADISDLLNEPVQCGFDVPWSQWDGVAVSETCSTQSKSNIRCLCNRRRLVTHSIFGARRFIQRISCGLSRIHNR